MAGLEKRSFRLAGHRTSVALEPEFWAALGRVAQTETMSVGALVTRIDSGRAPEQGLASLLRLTVLRSLILTIWQPVPADREGRQTSRTVTGEDA